LIFFAFSREWSKSRIAEQTPSPTSVTKTKGINQTPTKPRNHVTGVNATAEMKNSTAVTAALFSPNRTAKVFTPSALSPFTSTIPLVISLPVLERNAIDANRTTFRLMVPITVMLP
jgi:hypothetical protein